MFELPSQSVVVVLGTRPEIVKLAPVIRLLGPAGIVVHTDQHYDKNLSDVFFDEMGLPQPSYHFDIGGRSRGAQIGETVTRLSGLLPDLDPLWVIAQGDTNTTLGAALAANASDVPFAHIEAGLRSFDRAMPEEHNRVVCDHLADWLCAPTDVNVANLAREGIPSDRVSLTGNTVVEALLSCQPSQKEAEAFRVELGVPRDFVLATAHRPENVDNVIALERLLQGLAASPLPVVLPLHPRSMAAVKRFGLQSYLQDLIVLDPLPYIGFLSLLAEATLVVSDSGGIQEEVSVLKKPLVVVRNSTERPEVEGTFATRVAPGESIEDSVTQWLNDPVRLERLRGLPSPYGAGRSAELIVSGLAERVDEN